MPIIVPAETEDPQFFQRLEDSGAAVIGEEEASHQDVRPARIGLLNLMPGPVMERTEQRWLRFISHTVLQIEPVLVKFDSDTRETPGSSREQTLRRYLPFSTVAEQGLDGLIITGDNLELADNKPDLLPFEELRYGNQLADIIGWANAEVNTTIYSCLASHFALNCLFGLEREKGDEKILGVYEHEVISPMEKIVSGMDDKIQAPHSRWGNIAPQHLGAVAVGVVAVSERVGWLIAQAQNPQGGTDIYLQGHPEYWRCDLRDEHARDCVQTPVNYYPNDDARQEPGLTWSNDARALHSNWISGIYEVYSKQE